MCGKCLTFDISPVLFYSYSYICNESNCNICFNYNDGMLTDRSNNLSENVFYMSYMYKMFSKACYWSIIYIVCAFFSIHVTTHFFCNSNNHRYSSQHSFPSGWPLRKRSFLTLVAVSQRVILFIQVLFITSHACWNRNVYYLMYLICMSLSLLNKFCLSLSLSLEHDIGAKCKASVPFQVLLTCSKVYLLIYLCFHF